MGMREDPAGEDFTTCCGGGGCTGAAAAAAGFLLARDVVLLLGVMVRGPAVGVPGSAPVLAVRASDLVALLRVEDARLLLVLLLRRTEGGVLTCGGGVGGGGGGVGGSALAPAGRQGVVFSSSRVARSSAMALTRAVEAEVPRIRRCSSSSSSLGPGLTGRTVAGSGGTAVRPFSRRAIDSRVGVVKE